MNTLSPLGLITCFIFSMVLNGASVNHQPVAELAPAAYITNHSKYTIYFKPESRKANPGLDPNGAYPLAPGESYYLPFDAVVTPLTREGNIYRLPTGSRVIVNSNGVPEPANIVARSAAFLPAYGIVPSPCVQFAKLANPKKTLYLQGDISLIP